MILPKKDLQLFYKLHLPLLFYTNYKYDLFPEIKTYEQLTDDNMKKCNRINQKLFDNPETINEFINKNTDVYSEEEIEVFKGWNHFKKGVFCLFKHLKKYSIFISIKEKDSEQKVYGVIGLLSPLEEIAPSNLLPMFVDTILLPFKNKIIHNGFLNDYNIPIDDNIKSLVNDNYHISKSKYGIIENF